MSDYYLSVPFREVWLDFCEAMLEDFTIYSDFVIASRLRKDKDGNIYES